MSRFNWGRSTRASSAKLVGGVVAEGPIECRIAGTHIHEIRDWTALDVSLDFYRLDERVGEASPTRGF